MKRDIVCNGTFGKIRVKVKTKLRQLFIDNKCVSLSEVSSLIVKSSSIILMIVNEKF